MGVIAKFAFRTLTGTAIQQAVNRTVQAIQTRIQTQQAIEQPTRFDRSRNVQSLHYASRILNELIKRDTPVKTGRLRRSIRSFLRNSNALHPRSSVPYAVYQEEGTRTTGFGGKGISPKRFFHNNITTFRHRYPNITVLPARYPPRAV